MIAMYNYCPERDSPNDQSDMELNFDAGDLITVYGSMVRISGGNSIGLVCGYQTWQPQAVDSTGVNCVTKGGIIIILVLKVYINYVMSL